MTVVETLGAQSDMSSLQMDVPSTLQYTLMARLDRLGSAKEIAQMGATHAIKRSKNGINISGGKTLGCIRRTIFSTKC